MNRLLRHTVGSRPCGRIAHEQSSNPAAETPAAVVRAHGLARSSRPSRVCYLEDGPDLVAIAMNGWDEGHPAWWRNLEAHPDAVIRLAHQQPRLVSARPSAGEERDRLWKRWVAVDPRLDAYASGRSTETPVIVLEPRSPT